ncbi:1-phosphofructokinase [Salicibibacter halophilus]|uniref:Tagatose-6-phosphate kinase n=1 Tax=Salicibibacter halophilus TaxID=2502791 RepID=A0A514LHY7_9BACI|nr:1-phosphofructokinase [Salicibibacter halophilus]QDI91457.1 1-phosphofructokinase [Salicibibacter halophilus]
MIYTLTLNPAVDYIARVPDFEMGKINRSEEDRKYPGGKGINVSRVLHRLGYDNTALGFVGGFTGRFLKETLEEENIKTDFVSIQDDTRLNIKLKTLEETEINGKSPRITEGNMSELKQKFELLEEGDTLVLAGSLPKTVSSDTYHDIVRSLMPKGIRCYVDTNGGALHHTLRARPFFTKPNHHELAELYGVSIDSLSEAATYGRQLQKDYRVPHILVSMASRGALYIGEEKMIHIKSPKGTLVNSVGAGDSTVAGFLAKYEETNDLREAAVYAVAAGSASAFSEGFCTKAEVDRFSSTMRGEYLNI